MMGTGSKRSMEETPNITQAVSSEALFSPSFLWQLLMHFAEYRTELLVKEVMIFPDGTAYYICPRCRIILEREFMAYCDCCGQHLGWKGYKKARVVNPGNRDGEHI